MHASFSILDYAILILYVLGSVGIGLWFARSQKSVEGYFLAGREAPWWAVAISINSSDTTAISYLGCAALVFTGDLQLAAGTFVWPFAGLFVALIFVPFLAKHKVYTVYEFLEHRFNAPVRTFASGLFLLTRGTHLSVALFAATIVLSQVMGLPMWASLLVMGGLTTVYTVLGGMKAVLWTDVVQFFVLLLGLFGVLVGVLMAFHWDFGLIWSIASRPSPADAPWLGGHPETAGHTRMFDFGGSIYQMTFWAVMINTFFQAVGSYGSDQVLVQRYLSAGSARKMAASLIGGGLLTLPVNLLLFATGIFLVAYYSHFLHTPGHEWIAGLDDPNRVMSHFISNGLPGALGALVIAGLFAGTMSSLSAGLNSLSTATYVDFLTRFGKKAASEKQGVMHAKIVTCVLGLLIMIGAVALGGHETIFAIGAKIMSPFAGPLLGIFLVGLLSKRANSFGVVTGALLAVAATFYTIYGTHVHWLWYYVVGPVVGLVAGYALSFLQPPPTRQQIAP
jgi:SSS family transporter